MKTLIRFLTFSIILGSFSLTAEQDNSILCKIGQSVPLQETTYSNNQEIIKNIVVNDLKINKSKKSTESYSTNVITFQYTNDGWLQHIGVYPDCIICTNIAGPREGVQFIISNNGAILDMCHTYKIHKNYFTNKYSWGEVNTYENYQIVTIK
jgi:hypothetical protein